MSSDALKAATQFVALNEKSEPYLVGSRCEACDQLFPGLRQHCAGCYSRDCMKQIDLGTHGSLYSYTVVHRSYKGVSVPFVSAVVDMDGGGSIKGTMLNVPPDPDELTFGMPLSVVFRCASCINPEAEGYVSHFFTPALDA
ncbi:MAG: OB-fold domain-containing protein [Luminiphilus sp.]|nr:OB-fold domain-containing protein [Luminiphilus sp.]